MLDAEETQVTQPMAKIMPRQVGFVQFRITRPGEEAGTVNWLLTDLSNSRIETSAGAYTARQDGKPNILGATCTWNAGTRILVRAILSGATVGVASAKEIYIPFADHLTNTVMLDLPTSEEALLTVRCQGPDGAPLAGISRLAVQPTGTVETELLAASNIPGTAFYQAEPQADGSWLVPALAGVEMRLAPDLFDESVTPPAGAVLTPAAGALEVVLRLPSPLFTAPGGTTVHWVTKLAPFMRHEMTLGALLPEMPVLGPAEEILAVWGAVAPNRLAVWSAGKLQVFPLREMYLQPKLEDGKDYLQDIFLLPLFPQDRQSYLDRTNLWLEEPRKSQLNDPHFGIDTGVLPLARGPRDTPHLVGRSHLVD